MKLRFVVGKKDKTQFFEAFRKLVSVFDIKRVSSFTGQGQYIQLENSISIKMDGGLQVISLDGVGSFEYNPNEMPIAFALQELLTHYLDADILEDTKASVRDVLVLYGPLISLGNACHDPEDLNETYELFSTLKGGMSEVLKKIISEN